MPATMNELDFWSDDIQVDVLTPLMILRAQEPGLRRRTKGILQAKLETVTTEKTTIHNLYLIAPALDNYKEKILTVEHKPNLVYPCSVSAEGLPDLGQPSQLRASWRPSPPESRTAASQTEFIEMVKWVLKSPSVRGAIDSLLAKSNETNIENQTKLNPHPANVAQE